MRRILAAIAALTLVTAGCQDLDVTNPNNPDRDRVLSQPDDIESVIASTFRTWFARAQYEYPNMALAAVADEATGGFFDYGVHDISTEPRSAYNNSVLNTRNGVNENPWNSMYTLISSVNDGINALQNLDLDEGNPGGTRQERALAFAKMMEGVAHGYLGLWYDKALIVRDDADLETLDPEGFSDYNALRDVALDLLDESIAIAQSNSFTIPGSADWVNGIDMTNNDLVRLANSFAARFLAYTPRSPAERAAVDWNEVLARTNASIQVDLAPVGILDVFESNYRRLLARIRNASRPSDHLRPDNMVVGPADTSGAFQAWYATPSADKQPFQVFTPDRRIRGATNNDPGLYVGYNKNTIWVSSRGTYRWSYYFYGRSGAYESFYTGPQPTMTVDEMRLLKAEALIRLGRAAEAVPLINVTRVNNGQLAPVTVDGPPDNAACVPRKLNGNCGSLWDALRYEFGIEMLGIEGSVSWFNARGWGTLQEMSPLSLPIPSSELEILGLPLYTFGGSNPGSAPVPHPEACPVSLARC